MMGSVRELLLPRWWHYGWAGIVVGALLLNVFWPFTPGFSVWAFSLIPYPVAAAVILANRPGNRVGAALAVVGLGAGVIFIGSWAAWTWQSAPWSAYMEAGLGFAVPILFWGAIGLLYVFPTGTIPRRFSRGVFVAFTVVIAVMAVLAVVEPGPMPVTGRDNPMGGPGWVVTVFGVGIFVLVPGLVVGIWSAVMRRRDASPDERTQMRWFVTGTGALIGLVGVVGFVPELPPPYEQMLVPVVVAGFWALPVAIVAAITRYRLYEIDRIISRTVSYTVVVGLLAAVFFGVVVALQALLPAGSSSLAIAASTLVVAAGFNPLRRKVQRVVDRRFNRSRYDAADVVARVTDDLRDSVDIDEVVASIKGVITEVFGPHTLAVWVVGQDSDQRSPRVSEAAP
jgi:hypothetical protein